MMAGNNVTGKSPPCPDCAKIKLPHTTRIQFDGTIEEIISANPKEKLAMFYKCINSLLNGCGGAVVIHSNDQNVLDRLDQKIDQKLCSLISDGSLFHDVFERSYFDRRHLVFRVKPFKRKQRPLSTLDFQSKTSYDKGMGDPTYIQMSTFVEELCARQNTKEDALVKMEIKFEEGIQVFVRRDYGWEPFQEALNMQAKAMRPPANVKTTEQLVDYCWQNLRLREYITAFSKVKGGGVIYLGVFEHKTVVDAWVPAEPTCNKVVRLANRGKPPGWEIWQDAKENPPSTYYVTQPQNIKTKEIATGEFRTEAFELKEEDRVHFHRGIFHKIVEELQWVGWEEPFNPVKVHFHEVSGVSADHCVVEIKVGYYHGLCFFDKEGPVSYKSKPSSPGILERVETRMWIDAFHKDASQKIQKRYWRDRVPPVMPV